MSSSDTQLAGYRIVPQRSHYGEVEQRWLLVESEKRQNAELEKLQQEIEQQQKQLRQCQQRFAGAEDAHALIGCSHPHLGYTALLPSFRLP